MPHDNETAVRLAQALSEAEAINVEAGDKEKFADPVVKAINAAIQAAEGYDGEKGALGTLLVLAAACAVVQRLVSERGAPDKELRFVVAFGASIGIQLCDAKVFQGFIKQ